MAKWTIRNYSNFISEVRETNPLLSESQARLVYSEMRRDLERPVFVRDLKEHPEVTKAAINFAERSAFREAEEKTALEEIEDAIDLDYDYQEFHGGIDYGNE